MCCAWRRRSTRGGAGREVLGSARSCMRPPGPWLVCSRGGERLREGVAGASTRPAWPTVVQVLFLSDRRFVPIRISAHRGTGVFCGEHRQSWEFAMALCQSDNTFPSRLQTLSTPLLLSPIDVGEDHIGCSAPAEDPCLGKADARTWVCGEQLAALCQQSSLAPMETVLRDTVA